MSTDIVEQCYTLRDIITDVVTILVILIVVFGGMATIAVVCLRSPDRISIEQEDLEKDLNGKGNVATEHEFSFFDPISPSKIKTVNSKAKTATAPLETDLDLVNVTFDVYYNGKKIALVTKKFDFEILPASWKRAIIKTDILKARVQNDISKHGETALEIEALGDEIAMLAAQVEEFEKRKSTNGPVTSMTPAKSIKQSIAKARASKKAFFKGSVSASALKGHAPTSQPGSLVGTVEAGSATENNEKKTFAPVAKML